MTWLFGGALGGTRTPNLLIRSQMLYPLSYERRDAPIVYGTCHVWRPGKRHGPPLACGGAAAVIAVG